MRRLLSIILLISLSASAQQRKGDILLNVGLASGYGYPSGLTTTENSGIPTAAINAEYLLNKFFSIGPYAAYTYSFYKYDHPQVGYKDVWRGWDLGIRSTIHCGPVFFKDKRADIYLSAFGGYTAMGMRHDRDNIYRSFIDFNETAFSAGGMAGFRYFASSRLSGYVEAGLARKFFIGAGVGLRFPKREKAQKNN